MRSRDVINESLESLKEKKRGLKTSQSIVDREIQQVSKEIAFEDTLKGGIQTAEDDAYEKMLAISVKLSEQTGKDYRLILEPADAVGEQKEPFPEYRTVAWGDNVESRGQNLVCGELDCFVRSLSSRFGEPTRSIRNRIRDIIH